MTLPAQNHCSAGILTSCMDLTKHALDPSALSSRPDLRAVVVALRWPQWPPVARAAKAIMLARSLANDPAKHQEGSS